MEVQFLRRFSRDLDKIKKPKEKEKILSLISEVEKAGSIEDLNEVKKLIGFENAYRIRKGDYRIGVFLEGDVIEFARVAHRKDFYDLFP